MVVRHWILQKTGIGTGLQTSAMNRPPSLAWTLQAIPLRHDNHQCVTLERRNCLKQTTRRAYKVHGVPLVGLRVFVNS
jgi:hypothetical protein